MKIAEILRTKGHDVVTIPEARSVLEAIGVLVRHNIGALVVTERERPIGVFTERDVLRLAARSPNALSTIQVGGVMTRDPITAAPHDELHAAMGVMTERKIRHLPVIDRGELVGIVSIGDLLHACRDVAEEENSHLRQYIQGVG